jgi:chemotaxis protein MotA
MKSSLLKFSLSLLLGSLVLLIQWADPSGQYFNLPGLLWVLVGPVILTALAHSPRDMLSLFRRLPHSLQSLAPVDPQELQLFLHTAELYRTGNTRITEQAARRLQDPLWHQGIELVLQRTATEDVTRLLQWRISAVRDHYNEEIRMVRTLGAYAPAFGMLGTLMGLIEMMYALNADDLGKIGTAMGFSMLATAYGLGLANLLYKPVTSRLEKRCRDHVTRLQVQVETVRLLQDRSHPNLIRDYWQAYQNRAETLFASPPPQVPALGWVKASG